MLRTGSGTVKEAPPLNVTTDPTKTTPCEGDSDSIVDDYGYQGEQSGVYDNVEELRAAAKAAAMEYGSQAEGASILDGEMSSAVNRGQDADDSAKQATTMHGDAQKQQTSNSRRASAASTTHSARSSDGYIEVGEMEKLRVQLLKKVGKQKTLRRSSSPVAAMADDSPAPKRKYSLELLQDGHKPRKLSLVDRAMEAAQERGKSSDSLGKVVGMRRQGTKVLLEDNAAPSPDVVEDSCEAASTVSDNLPRFNRRTMKRRSSMQVPQSTLIENIEGGLRHEFLKVRNGKTYRRVFSIPKDKSCLTWESDKKRVTDSKVLASQMKRIAEGINHENFEEHDDVCFMPNLCFTLFYRDLHIVSGDDVPA